MKINELKLVYFSPTGTTRRVIMETARHIGLKSVSFDFSVYKAKKPVLKFAENDFALFAAPVYGGRVPALFHRISGKCHRKRHSRCSYCYIWMPGNMRMPFWK